MTCSPKDSLSISLDTCAGQLTSSISLTPAIACCETRSALLRLVRRMGVDVVNGSASDVLRICAGKGLEFDLDRTCLPKENESDPKWFRTGAPACSERRGNVLGCPRRAERFLNS